VFVELLSRHLRIALCVVLGRLWTAVSDDIKCGLSSETSNDDIA